VQIHLVQDAHAQVWWEAWQTATSDAFEKRSFATAISANEGIPLPI
jgi:hypothetical protein